MSQIIEALRALDPKNDDHWTADGLPRLDVVKASRTGITKAAPNFSRTNLNLDPKPKEDEVPAPAAPEHKSAFRMESSEFGSSNAGEDNEDDLVDGDAAPDLDAVVTSVQAASAALVGTKAALAAKQEAAAKAAAELEAASLEHDRAILAATNPLPQHVQTQHALMSFLASGQKQPREPAQIDKVMARKTGYGNKRPTFTPRKDS